MGVLHRFSSEGEKWSWQEVERKFYPSGERSCDPKGVSVQWLIGKNEGAPFFAMRYFEVEPGGQTVLDRHVHDHGVFVLRGKGKVKLGDAWHEVQVGDVIYVPSNEEHQFINLGETIFAFLCVIPNKEYLKVLGVNS